MKMRLFLFLFFACTLLAGRAMAQGCSTSPIHFPQPGDPDYQVPSGTCIANADPDSPTGQGGRLRWDNNNSHELQLFDSDDSGQLLWCANSTNDNGAEGSPTSNCWAIPNSILCLQQDGNMVIYQPQRGGPTTIDCGRTDNDGGQAVWASGTQHGNDGFEVLHVLEDPFFCHGGVCITRTGDRAVISNDTAPGNHIWVSLGYVD